MRIEQEECKILPKERTAGEMTQRLKALAVLPLEDLGSILSDHTAAGNHL